MTTETKKTILVPTDFTELGDIAINHAIVLAKDIDYSITLLHVIDNKTKAELEKSKLDNSAIEDRLKNMASEIKDEHNLEVHCIAKQGSIFTAIPEVATEIEANMIIIGTHGKTGIQKIIGSNILKIVTNAPIPVIVTHNKPFKGHHLKIVLPLDLTEHSRQKFKWAIFIASKNNAKIFVVPEIATDEFLKKRLIQKQAQIEKILEENKVNYEVIDSSKIKGSFAKKIITVSQQIEADLIMIMTSTDQIMPGYIISPGDDLILFNPHKIPVMCVNPRDLGIQIIGM